MIKNHPSRSNPEIGNGKGEDIIIKDIKSRFITKLE